MVIKNLYTYQISSREENQLEAILKIDSQHPLFKGHFPGFALTPGVCQLLMIREILEGELNMSLMLASARQVKFTAVHEPETEPEIGASISFSRKGDQLEVNAHLSSNEKVYLKLRGEFKSQR